MGKNLGKIIFLNAVGLTIFFTKKKLEEQKEAIESKAAELESESLFSYKDK